MKFLIGCLKLKCVVPELVYCAIMTDEIMIL